MEKEKSKATDPKEEQPKDPAVQRGEAAIEAARVSNPEPDEKQQQKEEKDAAQWRNEG